MRFPARLPIRFPLRFPARLPARRTVLKVVHWLMVPLTVWFLVVGPPQAHALGPWGFPLHSNLALLFVGLCLAWTADFVWRGLATTRTPKLGPLARRVHWWMHRTIVWGLFLVALGGFLLGLTASRQFWAGGWLPFAPPLDLRRAHDVLGTLHIMQFYALAVLIVLHALFHVWRHVRLRDNALRIMAPKALHRFL